jgi:hypothetical protein
MSKPTVEANYGSVECNSYLAGHNVHWIPVLRKWVDEPRLPMTIQHIEGNLFEITSEGKTERLYNHDPKAVINAIKNNEQSRFKKVGNTGAITIDRDGGHGWIYFGEDSFMDCQTPRPTYYERYRNIDKEITRLEGVLKTMTTEWDIQTTTRFIERAKHINKLQLTNAHEKLKSVCGYADVCSCGLNLNNIRRIDEVLGHITY